MSTSTYNRILYWALAMVPLAGLGIMGRVYGSVWFGVYFFFYFFIYRPLLDTRRLLSLNAIEAKDAWRFFVPFAIDHTRYIKKLWLG